MSDWGKDLAEHIGTLAATFVGSVVVVGYLLKTGLKATLGRIDTIEERQRDLREHLPIDYTRSEAFQRLETKVDDIHKAVMEQCLLLKEGRV